MCYCCWKKHIEGFLKNNWMKFKKKSGFAFLVLFVVFIYLFIYVGFLNKNTQQYSTAIHKVDTGFGYTIKYNDKILIKQDFIPAIQKKLSFCTEQDAQKIADVVKNKILKKENPSIFLAELQELKISTNCLSLQ